MAIETRSPMAPADVKRVSVNFSPSTYRALEELAEEHGGNLSEALRAAIALSKWFHDARANGDHILVERDGKLREIVKI